MNESAPRRSNDARTIAIAIIVAALLIGGVILYVARGPDPCEESKERYRAHVRQIEAIQDDPDSVTREEILQLQADLRRTLAEAPSDCEVDED